jgi:hypothetical protein
VANDLSIDGVEFGESGARKALTQADEARDVANSIGFGRMLQGIEFAASVAKLLRLFRSR